MFPIIDVIGLFGSAVSSTVGWAWDKVIQGIYNWFASGLLMLMEWVWNVLDEGATPRLTDEWFASGLIAPLAAISLSIIVALMLASAIQAGLAGRPELIIDTIKEGPKAIVATALTVVVMDVLIRGADALTATIWSAGQGDVMADDGLDRRDVGRRRRARRELPRPAGVAPGDDRTDRDRSRAVHALGAAVSRCRLRSDRVGVVGVADDAWLGSAARPAHRRARAGEAGDCPHVGGRREARCECRHAGCRWDRDRWCRGARNLDDGLRVFRDRRVVTVGRVQVVADGRIGKRVVGDRRWMGPISDDGCECWVDGQVARRVESGLGGDQGGAPRPGRTHRWILDHRLHAAVVGRARGCDIPFGSDGGWRRCSCWFESPAGAVGRFHTVATSSQRSDGSTGWSIRPIVRAR